MVDTRSKTDASFMFSFIHTFVRDVVAGRWCFSKRDPPPKRPFPFRHHLPPHPKHAKRRPHPVGITDRPHVGMRGTPGPRMADARQNYLHRGFRCPGCNSVPCEDLARPPTPTPTPRAYTVLLIG
jgi:hypothetical protein